MWFLISRYVAIQPWCAPPPQPKKKGESYHEFFIYIKQLMEYWVAKNARQKHKMKFTSIKHTSLLANSTSFFWYEASSPRIKDELSVSNIVVPSSLSYLCSKNLYLSKVCQPRGSIYEYHDQNKGKKCEMGIMHRLLKRTPKQSLHCKPELQAGVSTHLRTH